MRLVICFSFLLSFAKSQNPTFDWDLTFNRLTSTLITGSSVDGKGHCIVGGGYGLLGKGVDTRTGTFIRKYDCWGRLLWADSSSLTWDAAAAGIATDRYDNIYQTTYVGTNEGIYFAGQYYGPLCLYLLKYSPDGKLLWVKPVAGTRAQNIYINNDDVFILGNGFLIKLDLEGNKLFTIATLAFHVTVDKTGKICLSDKLCDENGKLIKTYPNYYWNRVCDLDGNTYCYFNDSLAKFDSNDNLLWVRILPKMSERENESTIRLEDDKLYVATGFITDTATFLKTHSFDVDGNFRWQYDHWVTLNKYQFRFSPRNISSHKGHVLISGWYGLQYYDGIALKLREPGAELVGVQEEPTTSLLEIFPNPGRHFIVKGDFSQYSSFKVTDANGKLLISEKLENCAEALQIDMSRQPQGVYLLSISGKKSTQHHKLLVD